MVLFTLAVTGLQAQKNYKRVHNQMLDQAKLLLANEEYEEAAKIYRRLVMIDTTFAEVDYEMGRCLVNMTEERETSIPFFERAVRWGDIEAHWELALARHRGQRFDEAMDLLDRYKQMNYRMVKDEEVERRKAMCVTAKEMMKHPEDLQIRNMGSMINSSAHDYCPLVTADGEVLYFTSRRKGTTGDLKDATGQWFEDIWMARRIDDIWTNSVNVRMPLNTRVHDATVGLNPDGSSMVIYRTGQDLISGDLYETRYSDGKWEEPKMMTERINSKYHEPSASIAPGGDEIYFTSDRPGGYGGRDLYRIRRLPNGEWSLPLNLGPNVNTACDEDAPFIHSDGITLFFSSNGHHTMGGFDIFKAVLVNPDINVWSRPESMGYPVNTVNDDIYFCLSEDGFTGWLSSERPGGMGLQDIYQVDFPGSQLDYMVVRGAVVDQFDEPLKARLIVTDAGGEDIVGVYNTNERTGRYLLVLAPGEHYRLTVEAQGLPTQRSDLHAVTNNGTRELPMDIRMGSGEQHLSRNE